MTSTRICIYVLTTYAVVTTLCLLSFWDAPFHRLLPETPIFLCQQAGIRTRPAPKRSQATKAEGIDRHLRRVVDGASGTSFLGGKVRSYNGEVPEHFSPATGASLLPSMDSVRCAQWGVVTTIHAPSSSIKGFSTQKDWCLVIVADRKTPSYNDPFLTDNKRVVVLGVQQQEYMAQKIPGMFGAVPWNHFGRKNIGYLYAIWHGAQLIWDFDDDNELIPPFSSSLSRLADKAPAVFVSASDVSCRVFNPYPRMGAETSPVWPRGFPLQHIIHECNVSFADGSIVSQSIGVAQSLANHDPDVDAVYRLSQPLPFDFKKQDTLVLQSGLFAPYNAQATMIHQDAFWSLLLPVTVHGRVSDIWRSYIGQRLMWDVGLNLAFTPPRVKQERNPHDYIADMEAEAPLYRQSEALINLLGQWQMDGSLPNRLVRLYIELYERTYIEREDVVLVIEWVKALFAVGYTFPSSDNRSAAFNEL